MVVFVAGRLTVSAGAVVSYVIFVIETGVETLPAASSPLNVIVYFAPSTNVGLFVNSCE